MNNFSKILTFLAQVCIVILFNEPVRAQNFNPDPPVGGFTVCAGGSLYEYCQPDFPMPMSGGEVTMSLTSNQNNQLSFRMEKCGGSSFLTSGFFHLYEGNLCGQRELSVRIEEGEFGANATIPEPNATPVNGTYEYTGVFESDEGGLFYTGPINLSPVAGLSVVPSVRFRDGTFNSGILKMELIGEPEILPNGKIRATIGYVNQINLEYSMHLGVYPNCVVDNSNRLSSSIEPLELDALNFWQVPYERIYEFQFGTPSSFYQNTFTVDLEPGKTNCLSVMPPDPNDPWVIINVWVAPIVEVFIEEFISAMAGSSDAVRKMNEQQRNQFKRRLSEAFFDVIVDGETGALPFPNFLDFTSTSGIATLSQKAVDLVVDILNDEAFNDISTILNGVIEIDFDPANIPLTIIKDKVLNGSVAVEMTEMAVQYATGIYDLQTFTFGYTIPIEAGFALNNECEDENEPNNDFLEATQNSILFSELPTSYSYTGSISTNTDVDIFRYVFDETGTLTVNMTGSGVDHNVVIYNINGEVLGYSSNVGTSSEVVSVPICELRGIFGITSVESEGYIAIYSRSGGNCSSDYIFEASWQPEDRGCSSGIFSLKDDKPVAELKSMDECSTCFDGILNGDEIAVDCGGPTCPSCDCSINMEVVDQTSCDPDFNTFQAQFFVQLDDAYTYNMYAYNSSGIAGSTIPDVKTGTRRLFLSAEQDIVVRIERVDAPFTCFYELPITAPTCDDTGIDCAQPLIITTNITPVSGQLFDIGDDITINWDLFHTTPDCFDGFQFQANTSPDFTNPQVDLVIENSSITYTATNPATIYWRVRPRTDDGREWDWTDSRFYTIRENGSSDPTCGAPGPLTISNITPTSATVSWAAASGNVAYYEVGYGERGTGYPIMRTTSNTSINLTGLDDDQRYEVRVRAICSVGASASVSDVFTTTEQDEDTGNPTGGSCEAPTRPGVTQLGGGQVRFAWRGPGFPRSFVFYRLLGSTGPFSSEEGGGVSSIEPVTTYRATVTLQRGRAYEYYAETDCTSNLTGNGGTVGARSMGPRSAIGFFTVDEPDCSLPPANLTTVSVEEDRAVVSWEVNDPEALFSVEIMDAMTGAQVDLVSGISGSDIPVTLFNLESGTAYTWRVRADCYSDGSSDWSDELSFTTPSTVALADRNRICVSETVNFSYAGDPVVSYSWQLADFGIEFSTEEAPSYTFNSPGIYQISLTTTDASGMEAAYVLSVQVIEPEELMIETITAACAEGNPGSLTVQLANGSIPADYTILWSSGETTASITPAADGSYSVSVTPPGGCESTASAEYIADAGLTTYYEDADMDGLGNPDVSQTSCTQPPGYVTNADDCDDGGGSTSNLTITCPTVTEVAADLGDCSYTVQGAEFDAIADCPAATISNDFNNAASLAGVTFENATTVEWTVTDGVNEVSCTIEINVLDNQPPTVAAADTTLFLDENGLAELELDDYAYAVSDNCGATVTDIFRFEEGSSAMNNALGADAGAKGRNNSNEIAKSLDQILSFTCDDVGNVNLRVEIIAQDDAGNENRDTITITVLDTIKPTVVCLDIEVALDENGSGGYTELELFTATDNCEVNFAPFDQAFPLSCDDLGTIDVPLTIADVNGNDTMCVATVSVFDNTSPIITCADVTVFLDQSGNTTMTEQDILDAAITSVEENCGDVLVISNPLIIPACDNVGTNPENIQVEDGSGNASNDCLFNIIVRDTIAPIVTVTEQTVTLTDSEPTMTLATENLVTATDNCGEAIMIEFDRSLTFTGFDIGTNQLNVTVTDVNGNIAVTTVTVVVTFEQPNLACRGDIKVTLDEDCSATVIPRMLFTGNVALLDFFSFDIVIQDDDPSNGPIIDGCGEFTYTVTATGTGDLELDFMTCWGTVTAEDKTPPAVASQVAPIDLLCVDLDENRVDLLPVVVSRCYRVNAQTGATIPGTMATALRNALSANVSSSAAVVPNFTDGCAAELEVCVMENIEFDADDPQCENVVLTRTFTATEIAICPSASGESNGSVSSSYVITFERPSLDDLDADNIEDVAEYDRCGVTTGGTDAIRADYPAPRPQDFPFLAVDGRTFPLQAGDQVCNIGVTFSDGDPVITCPNTYKFVRTYTVIDWCDPSDVRTFTQVVKVGDNDAPTFTGPTQDRNFDGEVDDDLIYTTNAGNVCAAFIILDSPGVGAVDNCTAADDIEITATIYPGGDLGASPIGSFEVDPFDGNPEVTSAIPVGCHLIRYTYTDECGNSDFSDFDFCVEDGTAPVAICEDGLNISISSGSTGGGASTGIAILTPELIDAGSYDDCTDVSLSIARVNGSNINTEPYDQELILSCADIGTVRVGLRVEDENGNVNFCWLDVLVEDKNVPTCIPPGPMSISCIEYNASLPADITEATDEQLDALFGAAVGIDNCEVTVTSTVSGSTNSCGVGSITRNFTATDGQGFVDNNNCVQSITIFGIHDYRITFPTDEESGCADIPNFDGLATDEFACDLITTNVTVDTIAAVNAPDACFTLRVNYDVINFCEYNQLGDCYQIPRDGDGIRNPDTQLLYLNVVPESTSTLEDDFAFLSRFTDRNFNPTAPQRDVLVDDGDDNDGSDDDNGNDSEEFQAANGVGFAYAQDDSRGYFCYIQFVDVYNEVAPTITGDQPDDCFAGSSAECTAEVQLTFVAEDECTDPLITVELDANYVEASGFIPVNPASVGVSVAVSNDGANYTVNASNVPVGNHAIRVRANDGCGNFDVEIIEFCVVGDKAPTPICIQTLTVTLMPDGNGGGMAAIWASDFIASDVEDCFGNVIENYSIYREEGFDESQIGVGDLGIDFTCDDLGQSVPVRVYAIAENGTADYCSVITEVQAFQEGLCDGGEGGNLAGSIATQNAEPVVSVEVTLTGAEDMDQMVVTNQNGEFAFINLPGGEDYTIQPAHPVAVDLATVTVADVVLIGNAILGSETFASEYDYLAADVDQDQFLSVGDMVSIQRVILGLDDMYSTGESWGFVPADVDVSNPFAETFPGVYNVNDLAASILDADFVGFAYGDVNSVGRSSASLEVGDVQLEAGQTHTMVISGAELAGFQGTLELGAGLELVDISYAGEGGLNLNGAAEGVIAMLFRGAAEVSVEVRATEAGQLSDLVSLTSSVTLAEGVNLNGTGGALNLAFVPSIAPAFPQNVLYQNVPNPAKEQTVISFRIQKPGLAKLTLRDIRGRVIQEVKLSADKGDNQLQLAGLDYPGVFSYTLEINGFTATKRMVVIK